MESNHQEINQLLDDFYGTSHQRTINLIGRYTTLYALPTFSKDFAVDPHFFAHATRSVNFVVIAAYNDSKEILAIHSDRQLGPDEIVGWRLLGGDINDDEGESIEEAVNRIVKRHAGLEIVELQPVAVLKNTFHSTGNAIAHLGIGFMARVSSQPRIREDHKWKFVHDAPDKMAFLNREVFLATSLQLSKKYFDPPFEEVRSARRPFLLSTFHKLVFKPISSLSSSVALREKIRSLIDTPKSILDLSAGDDELILNFAIDFDPEICVANDISWRQMAPLRQKAKGRSVNMLFTNHNIAEVPFAQTFDVVIYKNTLHHIRTKQELLATFSRLKAISKCLIVVDVEEPKRRRLSYLFHLYYTYVYGDGEKAHRFFTREKFEKLIGLAFPDAGRIAFDSLSTLRGMYMIAVIEFSH